MKKTIAVLALAFFCLTAGQGFAQRFRGGFTLGLDAAGIGGADYLSGGAGFHKVGVIAGAIINTSLTPKSTLQLEFNFIQKGSSHPPDSLNMGYYKIALAYLEVPLLIRRRLNFTIRKKPVTRFELEGGISAGRMIGNKVTGNTNYTLPSDGLFNKLDISLLLGLNYHISKNVYFCLRYSNSVIPSVKRNKINPYFITYTFNNGNNLVLQFSFKFVFGGVGQKTPGVEVENK